MGNAVEGLDEKEKIEGPSAMKFTDLTCTSGRRRGRIIKAPVHFNLGVKWWSSVTPPPFLPLKQQLPNKQSIVSVDWSHELPRRKEGRKRGGERERKNGEGGDDHNHHRFWKSEEKLGCNICPIQYSC